MNNILGLFFVTIMLAGVNGLMMGKRFHEPMGMWEYVSFGLFSSGMFGFLYVLFKSM